MSDQYAAAVHGADHRSARLERVLSTLLSQAPEMEAAAVVSFDGLPMASALPRGLDEDRVAAMSAALLSLGERAAQGLGRGDLSQVYVEGEQGTVFLVSADDEAVLVAVGARGAKVGLLLFEIRQAAEAVAVALRHQPVPQHDYPVHPEPEPTTQREYRPDPAPAPQPEPQPVPVAQAEEPVERRHARPEPTPEAHPQPAPVPVSYLPEPDDDRRWHDRDNGSSPRPRSPEPTAWT